MHRPSRGCRFAAGQDGLREGALWVDGAGKTLGALRGPEGLQGALRGCKNLVA